ncbi:hypothetical protein [Mesobacillus foraminis]|uniref:hypothetical protein n=1 Tax=Mesobacillus foraminis TaxID=279826 RepID=UPI000EF487B8|nr:hypothetical protein [Mesobacillus foraminis]
MKIIPNQKCYSSAGNVLQLSKSGTSLPLSTEQGLPITGKVLKEYQYFIMRLENTTEETLTLQVDFYERSKSVNEESNLSIAFDILPSSDVTIPISLSYLNSQHLFPSRTPGRLRMMVSGKPLLKDSVAAVFLKSRPFFQDRKIKLKEIYLSNEEEAAIHDPRTLVDEFG